MREYLQGALWVLPTAAVIVGLAGGALLSAVPVRPGSLLMRVSFQGTADDARQILTVVSATMITVTGIVFSLTVVSLQIASSQFSVRLLRTFMRDVPNQVVLAVFICTFAYSTGGLYTVGQRVGGTAFVPRVAVSGSLWLAFLSTAALVYFLHRLVHSIQIDTIMEGVQRRTLALIDDLFPGPAPAPAPASALAAAQDAPPASSPVAPPDRAAEPTRPAGAVALTATRAGYLQHVNLDRLAEVAAAERATVRLTVSVGDYVTAGGVLGWYQPHAVAGDGRAWSAKARRRGLGAIGIGFERTLQQDVRFGLRQLVDIALRALSPAVNDPYTGVQVVHHLSAVLSVLAGRPIQDDVRLDPAGRLLVRLPYPGFSAYLELACGQIRRCGAHEPMVLAALLQLLSDTAARCREPDRRAAVTVQVELIVRTAREAISAGSDRALVERAARLVREQAADPGREPPPPAAFGMVAAAESHTDPQHRSAGSAAG